MPTDGHPRSFRAPGRVNLLGDHTDYSGGLVLPVAIDRECVAAVRPRSDGRIVATTEGHDDAASRLTAATAAALADRGRPPVGADLAVTSSVPLGAGLSSSAAFTVAVASALAAVADWTVAPLELALACQDAEQRATGVPCGVMDQLASVCGVAGHAVLIDCRTLGTLPIALPEGVAIVVAHSGESRRLAHTPYAERRAHCEAVAARLGVPSLREAVYDDVADDPVARHVVTENARVTAMAMALAAGDLDTVGVVMAQSHASLRDDFGCSTPRLDGLVDALLKAGALGARLTGAGWGGCAVALVETDRVDAVRRGAADHDTWVCAATDGASEIDGNSGPVASRA